MLVVQEFCRAKNGQLQMLQNLRGWKSTKQCLPKHLDRERRGERTVEKMTEWNYVATVNKPTIVTHSCVGNFTDPQKLNLIIAKRTCIEIHLITPQGLQLMLDEPIYGQISKLELFRPHGEAQDFLLIATHGYKFCVLQWDSEKLRTRSMGDVFDPRIDHRRHQIEYIFDPDCRLMVLHLVDGLFKIIPFDNKQQPKEAFNIRLEEFSILDIKFLYGCSKPTIVVLSKDSEYACHIKTYEVSLGSKECARGPFSQNDLDFKDGFLIPVLPPLCGVLIIGKEKIIYCSATTIKEIPIRHSDTPTYGRVARVDGNGSRYLLGDADGLLFTCGRVGADGSRYLLGDANGLLHRLVITHEKDKVTGLKIDVLGKTSIASTISYLDNAFVYVGSRTGDSQLVKLNPDPDEKGSHVEVVERYVNLGPIADFCVVDLEEQGQGQVVTCSGDYKDSSLCVVQNGIEINDQASLELEGVNGMWSLRSSTDDLFYTFLVVSFISVTRIFEMRLEDKREETVEVGSLKEIDMGGFCSKVQTLFCHHAVCNQLIQVTPSSIRLVSSASRELRHEWKVPPGCSIVIATANATQVLLTTGKGRLFYLEIGDGLLTEKSNANLEYEVSCLDINPIGESPNCSLLAAVGMWTDIGIRIFSLPDLNLVTKEHSGEEIPRSVLLCAFEGISYLLCAFGDGHLLTFILNLKTGELSDRKSVSLGTQPITLHNFTSKKGTHVFAASDRPTVIYSSNKKLLYSNVKVKEVSHMCPINSAAFPDSLAFVKESKLSVVTMDDIQKLRIRSIPLNGVYAFYICHQEQSQTFAICGCKSTYQSGADYSEHFIQLLDGQTFQTISTYSLCKFEIGSAIISCSFSDDKNFYYCVGASTCWDNENDWGRILVFKVEDNKFKLIAEENSIPPVLSLKAFNGKLVMVNRDAIRLYRWMPQSKGIRKLQYVNECHIPSTPHVHFRGDFIIVGDWTSLYLLTYYVNQFKSNAVAKERQDCDGYEQDMILIEILDDDIYLSRNQFGLFTLRKNSKGATDMERRRIEVVGNYNLGDSITRCLHGSLVTRIPDSNVGQIPTVIFSIECGVIGVVASLPHEEYIFLEQLQLNLRNVIKGIGGLRHEQWRSTRNKKNTVDAKNFLDGDLIESFLDLSRHQMDEVSSAMDASVEELCKRVERLTWLHW